MCCLCICILLCTCACACGAHVCVCVCVCADDDDGFDVVNFKKPESPLSSESPRTVGTSPRVSPSPHASSSSNGKSPPGEGGRQGVSEGSAKDAFKKPLKSLSKRVAIHGTLNGNTSIAVAVDNSRQLRRPPFKRTSSDDAAHFPDEEAPRARTSPDRWSSQMPIRSPSPDISQISDQETRLLDSLQRAKISSRAHLGRHQSMKLQRSSSFESRTVSSLAWEELDDAGGGRGGERGGQDTGLSCHISLDAEAFQLQARVWELEGKLEVQAERMITMKAQLAARDLQLDKKHIELLQMTAKEESARAAAASALEQVVQFEQEAQNLRKGPGTPDSQEMKQMHARMVECIQVIKALNERIGEEAMKNTQLVAKNKVLEEGMGAQETEIKDMATQLEANKNILLQTRDQYARSMASWSSAKSHVEKEKADYELKLRELKDEASRLRWAFFAQ